LVAGTPLFHLSPNVIAFHCDFVPLNFILLRLTQSHNASASIVVTLLEISIFLRDLVPPEQEDYPFNIYSEITLYVPKPSLQLYKNKWPDIANYIHSF
jgi:hypothetical protein